MLLVAFIACENQGESFGEFKSRSVKTQDAVKGFHLLKNALKLCRGFHQAFNVWRYFISFLKLLFSNLTERKMIFFMKL